MTDVSNNQVIEIEIETITKMSCFKIKQIIEDLEKKLAKRYNTVSSTVSSISQNNEVPAGVSGSIIDNSYRDWVGSLRR
jgi:divalent metal cation (Fe/Co/Zn/Cd) transporter